MRKGGGCRDVCPYREVESMKVANLVLAVTNLVTLGRRAFSMPCTNALRKRSNRKYCVVGHKRQKTVCHGLPFVNFSETVHIRPHYFVYKRDLGSTCSDIKHKFAFSWLLSPLGTSQKKKGIHADLCVLVSRAKNVSMLDGLDNS